ncbi:hypothetical protein DPR13_03665 [Enterococcus faecium]|nr:hypothetical protein DPR13_03665 [Enterococcus faecium]
MLLSRKKSIIDIIVGSCSNDKKQKIVNRVEYREITYNKKIRIAFTKINVIENPYHSTTTINCKNHRENIQQSNIKY